MFDYTTSRRFDGKIVQIAFWDSASQEECDRLRPLSYLDSHAVLIVFSVDSPESFENIQEKVRTPFPFHIPHIPPAIPATPIYMLWGVSLFLSVVGLPHDKSGGQR